MDDEACQESRCGFTHDSRCACSLCSAEVLQTPPRSHRIRRSLSAFRQLLIGDGCFFSRPQVVSQAEAAGEVVALPSLGDIQGQSFGRPTVLVTQQVGGVEDIPVSNLRVICLCACTKYVIASCS